MDFSFISSILWNIWHENSTVGYSWHCWSHIGQIHSSWWQKTLWALAYSLKRAKNLDDGTFGGWICDLAHLSVRCDIRISTWVDSDDCRIFSPQIYSEKTFEFENWRKNLARHRKHKGSIRKSRHYQNVCVDKCVILKKNLIDNFPCSCCSSSKASQEFGSWEDSVPRPHFVCCHLCLDKKRLIIGNIINVFLLSFEQTLGFLIYQKHMNC